MSNPATLRYVRDVTLPYATDHGIELHELHKFRRDGTVETLHGRQVRPGSGHSPSPCGCPTQAPPGTRSCTLVPSTDRDGVSGVSIVGGGHVGAWEICPSGLSLKIGMLDLVAPGPYGPLM
jgi:hypothetical protein